MTDATLVTDDISPDDDLFNIAALGVVANQVYSRLDSEAVLNAIEEVLVNLIGVRRFAVYAGESFHLLHARGVDDSHAKLHRSHRGVAFALSTNRTWFSESGACNRTRDELLSIVPLVIDSRLVGVIGIMELLPHKASIQAQERTLLEFLSLHGAGALYLAQLHESHLSLHCVTTEGEPCHA